MAGSNRYQPYALPRDSNESNRLNLQHNVYKVNTGYLLHPRIASAVPSDAHIAEVGTGTGVWLRDLMSESPKTWTYTGFDISEAQFPKTRDDGVDYNVLNILEDVPDKHKGHYDAVHLRLLVCGLKRPDWLTAAKNILQLLKPGGWIQWQECDFPGMPVVQNVPGASRVACEKLRDFGIKGQNTHDKFFQEDVIKLLSRIQDAAFEDCREDLISSDRVAATREAANDVEFGAIAAICKVNAKEQPELEYSTEEVEKLIEQAKEELRDAKVYYRWNMHVVTGRKPR